MALDIHARPPYISDVNNGNAPTRKDDDMLTIYYPEGSLAYTDNVAGHEIASHIAGRSWHASEAEALDEFNSAPADEGVPSSLLGGKLVLCEEGVEDGVPFARYRDAE